MANHTHLRICQDELERKLESAFSSMRSCRNSTVSISGSSRARSRRHSLAGQRSKRVSFSRATVLNREHQAWMRRVSPLNSCDQLREANKEDALCRSMQSVEILDPSGQPYFQWLAIVSLVTVYNLWTLILRTAFAGVREGLLVELIWFILDMTALAVHVADIFMQMRTSYMHNGILERDLAKLKNRYLSSASFYVDVAACTPIDLAGLIFLRYPPPMLLQCLKLLKVYRAREFCNRMETVSHNPNAYRVLFLMHYLLVTIHWNACVYYMLSSYIGFGSDDWVYPSWNSSHDEIWGSFSRQYIYCFYWSTLTLTTIGELPLATDNVEYMFMTVDFLLGIIMFATLVGNVGGIISNTQKVRTKFQNKMDSVKSYMKKVDIPYHMQEKVINWFDYLWVHGHPVGDQNSVLNSLPDKLKAEIGIYVHFETLKKVDFFDQCEQSLLWELLLRLQMEVYSPGEYVCRKGDVGREMYIVSHGQLEVMEREDGKVLKVLQPGDYFGEISVLNLGDSQRRRTAFVRSVGYADLLCLSQNDLLEVLNDYPQALEMLREKGTSKLGTSPMRIDKPERPSINIFGEDDEVLQFSDDDELDSASATSAQVKDVMNEIVDLHVRFSEMEDLMRELATRLQPQRKSGVSITVESQQKSGLRRQSSAHL